LRIGFAAPRQSNLVPALMMAGEIRDVRVRFIASCEHQPATRQFAVFLGNCLGDSTRCLRAAFARALKAMGHLFREFCSMSTVVPFTAKISGRPDNFVSGCSSTLCARSKGRYRQEIHPVVISAVCGLLKDGWAPQVTDARRSASPCAGWAASIRVERRRNPALHAGRPRISPSRVEGARKCA
jgi:hypothetical protein